MRLNKDSTSRYDNWWGKAHEACTKNYRQLSMLGVKETVFPREEHASWLANTERSALKLYFHMALYRLSMVHLHIYKNK